MTSTERDSLTHQPTINKPGESEKEEGVNAQVAASITNRAKLSKPGFDSAHPAAEDSFRRAEMEAKRRFARNS